MYLFGVAPSIVVFLPLSWIRWGAPLTLAHTAVCVAIAALLTEGLLWGFTGVACARPWQPERANVRTWWPAYLAGFLLQLAAHPR